MSIENTLERIAVALEKLADNAKSDKFVPVAAPVVAAPVPNVAPAPIPAAPVPVAQAPVVAAPVTASPSDCPIKSAKDLMDFVMASYKALGAEKGAQIQGVLNSVGCTAINEVRPDQYAALYAGIEGLKA